MSSQNNQKEAKIYPKLKLFLNISSLIKSFPSIEKYYKDNYKLEKLSSEKLQMYINILFERHKNYDKLNYFDKISLIKNQYNNINLLKTEHMHNEFVYHSIKFKNYDNTLALDLQKKSSLKKKKKEIKASHLKSLYLQLVEKKL